MLRHANPFRVLLGEPGAVAGTGAGTPPPLDGDGRFTASLGAVAAGHVVK